MIKTNSNHATRQTASTQAGLLLRLGLFGCPPDTGNRGVSALGETTVSGLQAAAEEAGASLELTVFDYGKGRRQRSYLTSAGTVSARLVGLFDSRRYYRPSNLSQMQLASRLGLNGFHPNLRQLRQLDAVLDISGGDSFSDIYGWKRFRSIALPKQLALRLGRPLILLPQTYGPFKDPAAASAAGEIIRGAAQVWARDTRSLGLARRCAGPHDESRFHLGIDVAFGLRPRPPHGPMVNRVAEFRGGGRMLGLNVSGMLYFSDEMSRDFGLAGSYRGMVKRLLDVLLEDPANRVLLVPHVTSPESAEAGDAAAQAELVRDLPERTRSRVMTVPGIFDAGETKWIIGQCDWFCGTRMHACIGALSQGIPCTAIAYSDKTRGVFESVGVAEQVVDPRSHSVEEAIAQIQLGLAGAAQTRATLERGSVAVKQQLDLQFRQILDSLIRSKRRA